MNLDWCKLSRRWYSVLYADIKSLWIRFRRRKWTWSRDYRRRSDFWRGRAHRRRSYRGQAVGWERRSWVRTPIHLNSFGMHAVCCPEVNFPPQESKANCAIMKWNIWRGKALRQFYARIQYSREYLWRRRKIITSIISPSCWLPRVFLGEYLV